MWRYGLAEYRYEGTNEVDFVKVIEVYEMVDDPTGKPEYMWGETSLIADGNITYPAASMLEVLDMMSNDLKKHNAAQPDVIVLLDPTTFKETKWYWANEPETIHPYLHGDDNLGEH